MASPLEQPERRDPRRGVHRDRRRVMVLDWDDDLLAFATEALNSFRPGFEVATARDTVHAVQWLDSFAPDLLLIGIGSGRSWSDDQARALIEDPRMNGCRVVLLADEDSTDDGRDRLGSQTDAVLPRSPGLQDLLRVARMQF